MFIMIGSGWKIYNDEVIFGWLHFPEFLVIGKWAQHGLQWHFFGMWLIVLNGIAYVSYGLATGRFRRMLLPIRWRELIATVKAALLFRLSHDDPTRYNTVQKLLYVGVICIGILTVISGLAIWKPIQFSELLALFGSFQTARLVHFLVHDGDRRFRRRARQPRSAGAAHHHFHDHRRPQGRYASAIRAGRIEAWSLS